MIELQQGLAVADWRAIAGQFAASAMVFVVGAKRGIPSEGVRGKFWRCRAIAQHLRNLTEGALPIHASPFRAKLGNPIAAKQLTQMIDARLLKRNSIDVEIFHLGKRAALTVQDCAEQLELDTKTFKICHSVGVALTRFLRYVKQWFLSHVTSASERASPQMGSLVAPARSGSTSTPNERSRRLCEKRTASRTQRNSSGGGERLRFARFIYVVAAGAAMTGCAHTPLMRSCITAEQLKQLRAQEPPKIHSKLTGKAGEDTRPLAGSIIELRSYSGMLLGVLETCADK